MTPATPRDSTPPTNTSLTNDPIHGAIAAHRAACAAYDAAAEASDEENDEAFRALDQASQRVMRAEASTFGRPDRSSALSGSATSGGWRARVSDRDPVRRCAGVQPSASSTPTLQTGSRRS